MRTGRQHGKGMDLCALLELHLPGVRASSSGGVVRLTLTYAVGPFSAVCDFAASPSYGVPVPLLRLYETALDAETQTLRVRLVPFKDACEALWLGHDGVTLSSPQYVSDQHVDPRISEPCLTLHVCELPALLSASTAKSREAQLACVLSACMPHLGLGCMPPALFAAMRAARD